METHLTITNPGITQLAKPINVENCEVAVTRLIIPKQYQMIGEGSVKLHTASGTITKAIRPGHFDSIDDFVAVIQDIIPREYFIFSIDRGIVSVQAANNRVRLEISPYLSKILKLPQIIRGQVVGSGPASLMKQFMFVVADFVENQLLNKTTGRFLYVAHEEHSREFVKKPLYYPVCKQVIDSVNVYIVDERNVPVKFVNGTFLVSLHFKHKY